jgi:ATP-dependent DNA helicase RecQ
LCGACDCCLSELEPIADAQDTARKIISCVVRVGQSFGAAHVADVLLGSKAKGIVGRGHDQLSTHGLLKGMRRDLVLSCINQLVDAGDLVRSDGEYPVLRMGHAAQEVLKNERLVSLVKPKSVSATDQRKIDERTEALPLTESERGLFETLRQERKAIADERQLQAYMIFSDVTLEEISRIRPGTTEKLITARGVGVRKAADFGNRMVRCVVEYCGKHGLELDVQLGSRPRTLPVIRPISKHEQSRGRRR